MSKPQRSSMSETKRSGTGNAVKVARHIQSFRDSTAGEDEVEKRKYSSIVVLEQAEKLAAFASETARRVSSKLDSVMLPVPEECLKDGCEIGMPSLFNLLREHLNRIEGSLASIQADLNRTELPE